MPDEWATEWKAREKEAEERRTAAELRKRNELAIARQVIVQLWREVRVPLCILLCIACLLFKSQNGSHPITIRQQNILTYPTFNIAQCPSLMTKMGINAGAVVEIWNPRIKTW